ncbi:MAG: glycosyltransferase [Myxococcota bacterium]
MVGTWGYQKGSDLLTAAWSKMRGVKLVHAGKVDDVRLPRSPNFTHLGFLRQTELPKVYGRAWVSALVSRQEGLAVVQLQSLACGLPLVCSEAAGGGDLTELGADPDSVLVANNEDIDDIREKLEMAIERQSGRTDRQPLIPASSASWNAYASRYEQLIYDEWN